MHETWIVDPRPLNNQYWVIRIDNGTVTGDLQRPPIAIAYGKVNADAIVDAFNALRED